MCHGLYSPVFTAPDFLLLWPKRVLHIPSFDWSAAWSLSGINASKAPFTRYRLCDDVITSQFQTHVSCLCILKALYSTCTKYKTHSSFYVFPNEAEHKEGVPFSWSTQLRAWNNQADWRYRPAIPAIQEAEVERAHIQTHLGYSVSSGPAWGNLVRPCLKSKSKKVLNTQGWEPVFQPWVHINELGNPSLSRQRNTGRSLRICQPTLP